MASTRQRTKRRRAASLTNRRQRRLSRPMAACCTELTHGYNYDLVILFQFSTQGEFLGHTTRLDSTPAVYAHDGTFSVIVKDNHYDADRTAPMRRYVR